MNGVRIHAGLLLVALVASVLTWTRDRPSETARERVLVWNHDTVDMAGIEYRSDSLDIDIFRRSIEGTDYLWGRDTRKVDGVTVQALTFPVGGPGRDIMEGLAQFRVIRDLGVLDADELARYGLESAGSTLTVRFAANHQALRLGNPTPGGSDRYGLDAASGRTYVVPGELVSPLETGEGALRERRLHYFQPDEVTRVRTESAGGVRTMVRTAGEGSAPATWTDTDGGADADQGFANFMERVDQLAIDGFPDPEAVGPSERSLRVDYFGEDGEALGFVELHRTPSASGDGPDYYLLSERVPVPAYAIRALAERVDLDLGTLF